MRAIPGASLPGNLARCTPSSGCRTSAWPQCSREKIGRPAPHRTPSGGGPAPTPDRIETPGDRIRLRGIDHPTPVTEGMIVRRLAAGGELDSNIRYRGTNGRLRRQATHSLSTHRWREIRTLGPP